MNPQSETFKLTPIALPSLKGFTQNKSNSPSKYSSNQALTKTNMGTISSSTTNSSPRDFIHKHQTFYNNLFKKMKMDTSTKKLTSISVKDSPSKTLKPLPNLNLTLDDSPSEINHIKQNIFRVIQKPPTKKFTYLNEDNVIRRGREPKKHIRGLDDLYNKIDRVFMQKKRAEEEGFSRLDSQRFPENSAKQNKSQQSNMSVHNLDSQQSTVYVQKVKNQRTFGNKKKTTSNYARDEKPEVFQPDNVRGLEFGIFIVTKNAYIFCFRFRKTQSGETRD